MEGIGSYPHSRERGARSSLPYPPPSAQQPRATSRASNNNPNTRTTPHSKNSLSSNLGSTPTPQQQLRLQQHASRLSNGSDYRPRSSRLSREPTAVEEPRAFEPGHGTPVVSGYLQEKLQRERRFENERLSASHSSSDAMSASAEARVVQSSPVRASLAEGRRPRSSGGADPAKKKAMGLMEMEQTITKLHKENFDLKFELYHRRERQTELEGRLDTLKTEKDELENMNDDLLGELEKRDKAIEEAVAMIVGLEATVEKLHKERDILRAVGGEVYRHHGIDSPGLQTPKPGIPNMQELNMEHGAKTLARMPSFFSDMSENTENLRSVYLGHGGSNLGSRRALDVARDDDMGHLKLMSTPSLSVLSESSFVSVYGRKYMRQNSSSPAAPSDPSPGATDGAMARQPEMQRQPASIPPNGTPTRIRRSSSGSRNSRNFASGTFSSISDVLDASPLQKLQKSLQVGSGESVLNELSAANGGFPAGHRQDHATHQEQHQRERQRTKQEKREALRKVMTDGPRELTNPFPPTPDTISTSTLGRYKNSNDTLSQQQQQQGAPLNDRGYLVSQTAHSGSASRETTSTGQNSHHAAQAPSTSAFNSRNEDLTKINDYFENRLSIPRRPRSADETTTSHHRRGANGWGTDSSDDEFDDGASVTSYDYWMREGLKPNRRFPNEGVALGERAGGRTSPDLFSFPTSGGASGGWSSGAMFGNLGGTGYLGVAPAPTSQTLDALGASLPAPQAGLFGSGLASPGPNGTTVPPPPRRSSLHARTGSTTNIAASAATPSCRPSPLNGKLRKSPVRPGSRSRSNSFDGNLATPTLAQHPPPEPPKRHYPPITGQPQQARRSGGIQGLFRRSIGGGSAENAPPQPPASAPPPETPFKSAFAPPSQPPTPSTAVPVAMVGVPSWSRRTDLGAGDDDLSSATPPPIMRRPRARRGTVAGDGYGPEEYAGGAPLSPALPSPASRCGGRSVATTVQVALQTEEEQSQPSPGGASQAGRRRNWLGLGRVGSLRKQAG